MPFEVCTCSTCVLSLFSSHDFKNVRVATTEHFSCSHLCSVMWKNNVSTQRSWLPLECIWMILLCSPLCLWSIWEQLVMSIAKILDWAADNFVYLRKLEKQDSWNNTHTPQPHHKDFRVAMAVQSILTSHLSPFHKSFLFEGNCGWSSFVQFL